MNLIKKGLDKVLSLFCIGLFGFLVLLVTWQVFTRFVLNDPSVISEELAKYCFVWLVLFGAAYVFGEKGHMSIEFIKHTFPQKWQLGADITIEVVIIVFAICALVMGGYNATSLAWTQMAAALQIPVGYLYAAMPLSGLCIVFYCLHNIYHLIKQGVPQAKKA
ncbi:TRAP transporter small permease [Alkalihalobacillus oceani]|uniref:TRAP transporter small permease n=1 Tax=Halalkalibacter oceani TaxID=1653776 RepID=UPI002040638D|nr:TRAP transporter small permease [Halalkalibacter oceani]MCM3761307.1 TRAP transporter small permease [Halalkalibacter oceani]